MGAVEVGAVEVGTVEVDVVEVVVVKEVELVRSILCCKASLRCSIKEVAFIIFCAPNKEAKGLEGLF